MREYADDVDIAPIELMIVVRTVNLSILRPACLMSCMPWSSRSPHYLL